jgi:hypothetical protein
MLFTRPLLATLVILAAACGGGSGSPHTPLAPTPSVAALTSVSGSNQRATAGDPLGEPFAVRVTDATGKGIGHLPVAFEITHGLGAIGGKTPGPPGAPMLAFSSTNANGIAEMTLVPYEPGDIAVTASIADAAVTPVIFTARVDMVAIELVSMQGGPYGAFVGPCRCASAINVLKVPVGVPIEWRNPFDESWTVTSTSMPAGAPGFESGPLSRNSRFRFVPEVRGTWEYRDRFTGLTATLIVE